MKYVVFVFLVACWIVGIGLNSKLNSQLFSGVPVSEETIQVNECSQVMLWTPTPLIIGLIFILYPSSIILWLQKKAGYQKNVPSRSRYIISAIGIFLLALIPLDGTWAQCKVLFNLFGK
jgi:H+/Cl- antiporter ClcA